MGSAVPTSRGESKGGFVRRSSAAATLSAATLSARPATRAASSNRSRTPASKGCP